MFCEGSLRLDTTCNIRVESKLRCQKVLLTSKSGDIRLSSEAFLEVNSFDANANQVFIDGIVSYLPDNITTQECYPNIPKKDELILAIKGDLQVGRDALIGSTRKSSNTGISIADNLKVEVTGNICNFGKIQSKMVLRLVCHTLLSCRECTTDTAHRYYESIKRKFDVHDGHQSPLNQEVRNSEVQIIHELLSRGEDPHAPLLEKGITRTKKAELQLSRAFCPTNSNERSHPEIRKVADEPASIIRAWNNRSGLFASRRIECTMTGSLMDLAQFKTLNIDVNVEGDIIVENKSICTISDVSGQCNGIIAIDGIMKAQKFSSFNCKDFKITKNGIIIIGNGGNINVSNCFNNENIIKNNSGQLRIISGIFQQGEECKLISEEGLVIKILKKSNKIEGYIEADYAHFAIESAVVANCQIHTKTECTFTVTNLSTEHGQVTHKGLIKVQNGPFKIRSSHPQVESTPELNVEGKILARGFIAISSFVKMYSKSAITIYPDLVLDHDALHASHIDSNIKQSITFLVGKLYTQRDSLVRLKGGNHCSFISIVCDSSWIHKGRVIIDQSSDIKNYTNVRVCYFRDCGTIDNIDNLFMIVGGSFELYSPLMTRFWMVITGKGRIQNQSVVKCHDGPVEIYQCNRLINTKKALLEGRKIIINTDENMAMEKTSYVTQENGISNKGIIRGLEQVKISTGNIDNKGVIESMELELHWKTTKRKTSELRGQVVAKTSMTFVCHESTLFHLKCFGGRQNATKDGTNFTLPENGIYISCYKGSVVSHVSIVGQSDINIKSMKGFSTLKNIDVRDLTIVINNDNYNISDKTSEHSSLDLVHKLKDNRMIPYDFKNISTELFSHMHIRKKAASLFILNESVVSYSNVKCESEIELMELAVKTLKKSKLYIAGNLLYNSLLVLDCNLCISSSSQITAKTIRMTDTSICKVGSTANHNMRDICQIFSEGNIHLQGCLNTNLANSFPVRIESETGNIKIQSNIHLHKLCLVAGRSGKICIKSKINIAGELYVAAAESIKLSKSSKIECKYFSLLSETSHIQCDGSLWVNGRLNFEHANKMTIKGNLKARGINARFASVEMLESSNVTILPASLQTVQETQNRVICYMNHLKTHSKSVIEIWTEDNTVSEVNLRTWEHHGTWLMKSDSEWPNEVYLFVEEFTNAGQCENIHALYLIAEIKFSNYSILSVKTNLKITGQVAIQNHQGAVLQCTHGCISIEGVKRAENKIDQQTESIVSRKKFSNSLIQNHGNIESKMQLMLEADSIENTGIVQSLNADVYMQWNATGGRILHSNGIIKSPIKMYFRIPSGDTFYCKCTSHLNELIIPRNGLFIECNNGVVVLETNISQTKQESLVRITSMRGCIVKSNFKISSDMVVLHNSQNQEKHSRIETTQTDDVFALSLESDSLLSLSTLIVATNNRATTFHVTTQGNGKILCNKKIDIDAKFVMRGLLEISSKCILHAYDVKLEYRSECKINTLHEVNYKTDAEIQECKIHAENELQINGSIIYEHNETDYLSLINKYGDIILNGSIKAPYLSVAVAEGKMFSCNGKIEVYGMLRIHRARSIIINETAVIICGSLLCIPVTEYENKSESFTIRGRLCVKGPVHCTVKSLDLSEGSQLEITSDNENENAVFDKIDFTTFKGFFKCNIRGYCFFDCERNVIFEKNAMCNISTKECIFTALGLIRMHRACTIEVQKGKMYLTNAKDNETTIQGNINLSGKIIGSQIIRDGKSIIPSDVGVPMLEIEGQNVTLNDLEILQFHSVDLFAAMNMVLEETCRIHKLHLLEIQATKILAKGLIFNISNIYLVSEETIEVFTRARIEEGCLLKMLTTTTDIKGDITHYKNVNIDTSNMLVLGRVDKIDELRVLTNYVAVNCGFLQSNKTGIVAPIYINCPSNINGSTTDSIAQLGSTDQRELIIEGLLCIFLGSHIQGRNINIKSVLHFAFASKLSTIPTTNDLDRWKLVVDNSLSQLDRHSSTDDLNNLMTQATKIQKVVCNLSVSSHLCQDIIHLTENIRSGGLHAFKLEELVTSLDNAHKMYVQISPLTFTVSNIRIKCKNLKDRSKKVAKDLISKLFGPDCFSENMQFQSVETEKQLEGTIIVQSFVYEGNNTNTTTSGNYHALSLELNGQKGAWKNGGHFETCGDIIISASKIEHNGGNGRLLKTLAGSIQLEADNVYAHELKAKNLIVNATENVEITSVEVTDTAHIDADTIQVSNGKSNTLHLQANKDISIGKITTETLDAQTKEGNIDLQDNVTALSASLKAETGGVFLKGRHKYQSLQITAKQLNEIESFINNTDVNRDLQISDHLGLIVSDQDVVLANKLKSQFSVSLKAKSIVVKDDIDTKNISLDATNLNVRRNVKIKVKESVSFKARSQLMLSDNSSVIAGKDINFSCDNSVDINSSKIEAAERLNITSGTNININTNDKNGPSDKTTILSRDSTFCAANNITIGHAEVQSTNTGYMVAGNEILLRSHTYETSEEREENFWFGLVSKTIVSTTTHVEKPQISGKSINFKAGGTFTSIGGEIRSHSGTLIHAKGKVSMLDVIGTTKTKTTSKTLWLKSKETSSNKEISHGTKLVDSSHTANTSIISDDSDIEWHGSTLQSSGNVKEIALRGNVTHKSRILTEKKHETSVGLFLSANMDELNLKGGLQFQTQSEFKQSTSNETTEIKGNYDIEALGYVSGNAHGINVAKDMSVNAKTVSVEGAELLYKRKSTGLGIGIENVTAKLDLRHNRESKSFRQVQNFTVAGKVKINAKDVNLEDVNADFGKLEGDISNMKIKSNKDTESSAGFGIGIEADLLTRTISGGHFNIGVSKKKCINQPSRLNIRNDSAGLKVGTLTLAAAEVVFDGDVHDFSEKIVTHDVHEALTQINLNFAVSNPVTLNNSKLKIGMDVGFSRGSYRSCIVSQRGAVHEAIRKQVNNPRDKCRKVNASFNVSVAQEFEGNLSKKIVSIAKLLCKASGKHVLSKCRERLCNELGLPNEIVNRLLKITEGGMTLDKICSFCRASFKEMSIPIGLFGAIEKIITDCNPSGFIDWICMEAHINYNVISVIIGFMRNERDAMEVLLLVVECVSEYFCQTDVFTNYINTCINLKDAMPSTNSNITYEEGRQILATCNLVDVHDDILKVLSSTNNYVDWLIYVLKSLAKRFNISFQYVDSIKQLIEKKDISEVVNCISKKIRVNNNVLMLLTNAVITPQDPKEIIKNLWRITGIPDVAISVIEETLKQNKCESFKSWTQ